MSDDETREQIHIDSERLMAMVDGIMMVLTFARATPNEAVSAILSAQISTLIDIAKRGDHDFAKRHIRFLTGLLNKVAEADTPDGMALAARNIERDMLAYNDFLDPKLKEMPRQ